MSSNLAQQSPETATTRESGKNAAPHSRPRYWLYLLVAIVLIGGLLFFGWLPRQKRDKAVQARANGQKSALPIVQVMTAQQASRTEELTLPGTVVPVSTTHVYSRAAGYIKSFKADIGDSVHRGQVLAIIESPELDATVDQQRFLLQASTDALKTARSQFALQQATYNRVHTLFQHGVLSQQDDDVAAAAEKAAADAVQSGQNNVSAATSSLEHWTALASFEQVRAPINGTVTARNVEVGSLVSAAGAGQGLAATSGPAPSQSAGPPTGGAQGGELFQISNIFNLRAFVSVPEEDALQLQTGQTADLTFSELPGQQFQGKVIRSSDSLSQQNRTLLLEIQIIDPHHRLRPGMFASVKLRFRAPEPGILISGDSVIPRAQGQFVALVDNNIIHLQEVHVGRDLGTQVYVTSGLSNGAQVVVNPTDAVQEGVHVDAKPAPKGQEK